MQYLLSREEFDNLKKGHPCQRASEQAYKAMDDMMRDVTNAITDKGALLQAMKYDPTMTEMFRGLISEFDDARKRFEENMNAIITHEFPKP